MKYILIVIGFLYCTSASAQVDKIEHFYIRSPQSEKLYHFFKANFQLPVIAEYQDVPGATFEAGALSLGNVVLEIAKFEDETRTMFEGIGLQPQGSAENAVKRLDAAGVVHDSIQSLSITLNKGEWDIPFKIFGIHNMLPEKVNLFYCDYIDRKEIYKNRKDASDSLALLQGGPLGIIGVKDIVVGCNKVAAYSDKLSKLPGIKKEANNRFTFESGPSIQLINSNNAGFEKIIITINSLANAKSYLQAKKILGRATKSSVFIDPQAIDGLTIELVEK